MTCIDDLAEARAALHQLTLGQQVVSLAFEGETVRFTASDRLLLARYVRDLESQCGGPAGEPMPRQHGVFIY